MGPDVEDVMDFPKLDGASSELSAGLGHRKHIDTFLTDHLKLWKDEGIPAPCNELQSIQAWLACLGRHGQKETASRMRARMLLLMRVANELHEQGSKVEDEAGIYENRPDMRPNASLTGAARALCAASELKR